MADATFKTLLGRHESAKGKLEDARAKVLEAQAELDSLLGELKTAAQREGLDGLFMAPKAARGSKGGGGKRGPRKSEAEVNAAIVKAAGSKKEFKTSDIEAKVTEELGAERANISADMKKAVDAGVIKDTGKKEGLAKIYTLA